MTVRLDLGLAPVTRWVPRGGRLSDARWSARHRVILWVLWVQLPVLAVVGAATRHGTWHLAFVIALLGLGGLLATLGAPGRRLRTLAAVLTLVSSSAVLVHLTDGQTESHFHFFVVVAVIALYQEWLPFAVTVLYVVLHHGVLGVWWPRTVYSHEGAWQHPLLWALVHGGFVVLMSLAVLGSWRLAEVEREAAERVLRAAGDGIYGVDARGRITFANPVMGELLGTDVTALEGQDHHVALGHRLPSGAPVAGAECGLCLAVGSRAPLGTGDACLRGETGVEVPVDFIVRPMDSRDRQLGSVVTVRDLRVRRLLEVQRRRAEVARDQLASVAEAASDLAVIGLPDGRVHWMNPAGKAVLGFAPEEDITRYRIEDLFSAEEMARVYAEVMPVVAEEGDWQGQWTLQAREGTPVPAWATVHRHDDEHGHSAYVSAISRDLRPQLAEERERRESARRLALAETVAGIGSWEWDLTSDTVMWSPGMYRLHAREPGSGVERFETWVSTLHPDDREEARRRARQWADGQHLTAFTYRAVRDDGREIVIEARVEIVNAAEGVPSTLVGTLQDITERHAVTEALRSSNDRVEDVIAHAGEVYVQTDQAGLVSEWNRRAEAVFGWSREEVLGRSLPALLLPYEEREAFERRAGFASWTPDAVAAVEPFENTMRHRSGHRIPVEITVWATTSGGIPLFSCVIRDISARQAAERAKDEFISVVGHELRTPLTSIHGALGLLRAGLLGELNDRGRHMVGIATHNTDRLVRLINDILDIERLNSGKVSLQPRECDLAELAELSVEVMRPLGEEAGVELSVEGQRGIAVAWVDPDRLEQTFTNLLSNAVKFSTPGGKVQIAVRAEGDTAVVEVRDHGRGIPPADLERIFDRFHQVDASDSREKGGTGLGLAISRTIVEQHGGRLWAESVPGQGTVMTMELPLAGARSQDGPSPATQDARV